MEYLINWPISVAEKSELQRRGSICSLMLEKEVEQRSEKREPGLLVGWKAGNMTSQLKTDSIKEVCQQYVVLDM